MTISGKRIGVSVTPQDPDAEFLLSPAQLQELISAEKGLALIDVRGEREFKTVRLEGARLATRELVEEIFTKWPKDSPIVVYDHTGRMGLDAAKALAARGFTRAKGLRGGIDAWSEAVDPLLPRY